MIMTFGGLNFENHLHKGLRIEEAAGAEISNNVAIDANRVLGGLDGAFWPSGTSAHPAKSPRSPRQQSRPCLVMVDTN